MKIFRTIFASNWVYILKSRQIGNTTAVAAYFFWKFLFNNNFRLAVLAHKESSAQEIFKIYKGFFKHLPAFLKSHYQVVTDNMHTLELDNGSIIRAVTAGSDKLAGSTLNAIHASELAKYANLEESVTNIFPALDRVGGQVIIETTANGLNQAYKLWLDDKSRYTKLFIPWIEHEEYANGFISRLFKHAELNDWEQEYQKKYNLSDAQISWVSETINSTLAGNYNQFNQEYPITAEVAFITSGQHFFRETYAAASLELAQQPAGGETCPPGGGEITYEAPVKWGKYIMGIDTAAGNPKGDFSAISIINIDEMPLRCRVVFTYKAHIDVGDFCLLVKEVAERYKAFVVPEKNSYGLQVSNFLRDIGYPWLYRTVIYDKMTLTYQNEFGFNTSGTSRPLLLARLQEMISKNVLDPVCRRLKHEMNTFVYKDNTSRPEADTGAHDDLVFATGFALMGYEQAINYIENVTLERRPRTQEEIAQWQMKHRQLLHKSNYVFSDDGADIEQAVQNM